MLRTVGVVVTIALVSVLLEVAIRFGAFKQVKSYNDKGCVLIDAPSVFAGRGAEDFVVYKKNMLITGIDDRHTLWVKKDGGPYNTKRGDMVLVDARFSPPQVKVLPVENFPANIAFHPHGLYLRKNLLHVINHAYEKGGERIEIFQILENAETGDISLKYLRFLQQEEFSTLAMGHLNDLIVVGSDLYVTVYLAYPDPVDGRNNHTSWQSQVSHVASTFFFHCKLAGESQRIFPGSCVIHPHRFGMANGIATDLKGERVLIIDIPRNHIIAFNRDQQTGALTYNQSIPVHHTFDNIVLDETSGLWTLGAIPKILENPVVEKDMTAIGWVGAMQLRHDANADTYTVKDLVIHDGSMLSAVSGAATDGGYVYMGSFLRPGIMQCPLKL